ncbi:MAG TPA: GspH/FimT family pseudopilin [Gammaproteobacteria bacterium]
MKRQSGFTLVEALITLAVASILASMAIPSFKSVIQNDRLVSQSNDLLGAMTYARNLAITANVNATVCISSDLATCSGSNWALGWIVCQEADNASTGCATGNSLARVFPALSGSNTLTNASNLKTLTFAPNGALTTGNGLYFDLCDSRGAKYGRAIYIYPAGQARVSQTIGKQMNGTTDLTC